MGLDYCGACGSLEQGFRSATLKELVDAFSEDTLIEDIDPEEPENRVCKQCGELGTHQGIPEHDDYDMER